LIVPTWKKYLSYLFELHIESAPSEFNPHLYVSLRNGRYQLSTANAIYSYADLYDNFSSTFKRLEWQDKPDQVLLLGFGLGSIPYMLEKKFDQLFRYTAVEIDENVLYLANKYTLPELKSAINIIAADAFAFVQSCNECYDMICMDVFLDDIVPTHFEQESFLLHLNRILTPEKGILLFNKLAASKKDREQAGQFLQRFKKVFPKGGFINARGNWMLINDTRFIKKTG